MSNKENVAIIDKLIKQDNIPAARKLAEKWVQNSPSNLLAIQYAFMTQLFDGDAQAAEQSGTRAIRLAPQLSRNQANLGIALMTQGKLEKGLSLYEARYASDMVATDKVYFDNLPVSKQWQGQPLTNQRIFVAAEQGFGDQIQFIRFASELKKWGASKVIAQVRPELLKLLQTAPNLDVITLTTPDEGEYDVWCPLLSLPFQMRMQKIPSPSQLPYLYPDSNRQDFWQTQLSQWFANKPVIGIVWAGTPGNSVDGRRSLKTKDMLNLLNAKGRAATVSLQLGSVGMEMLDEQCARGIVPLMDLLTDFHETAAVIQNLDLVISVDTAVAHLAGALGKDVWLLLPKGPDWRWGLDGVTTPWYPSMRLFRQPVSGDWDSVIKMVSMELTSRFTD